MRFQWWKNGSRLGAVALVAVSAVVAQGADDEQKQPPQGEPEIELAIEADGGEFWIGTPPQVIGVPVNGPGQRMFIARARMSDHWLGLDCAPCSPALRSQLKIDGECGLVIENLVPESPATKAGLKQYDVLLSAGETDLKEIVQLMKLIDENKDQEIQFNVIRGGEKLTVAVKPEKRPVPKAAEADVIGLAGDGEKAFEVIREHIGKAGMPMRMQFFHPGVVLPPGAQVMPFPDNLHVRLHKHGAKPAEIVVEQGDKRWSVTEDKLAELPDDVRPHVEAMLGRMPMPKFDVQFEPAAAAIAGNVIATPALPAGDINERIERQLAEMAKRMEEMQSQLDKIREQNNAEK